MTGGVDMACCGNYRMVELVNSNIGAVAENAMMPLGRVTRRISKTTGAGVPFQVITAGADTVELTEHGWYQIKYNASVVVGGTGTVSVTLLVNGMEDSEVSATAAGAGTLNLTLIKEVRVCPNCASAPNNCPIDLQFQLGGASVTGGNSVLIVDSCVNGG